MSEQKTNHPASTSRFKRILRFIENCVSFIVIGLLVTFARTPLGFGIIIGLIFLNLVFPYLQRIPSVDLLFYRAILSIFRFRWLKYAILQHKFHILSSGQIIHTQMINPIKHQHDLIPLMLKIIATTPTLVNQFPPIVRQRIEQAYLTKFEISPLQDFYDYYAGDRESFAIRLANGGYLSALEQERLIYETTPQILEILENKLSFDHPLLEAIRDHQKICLENDLSLLK